MKQELLKIARDLNLSLASESFGNNEENVEKIVAKMKEFKTLIDLLFSFNLITFDDLKEFNQFCEQNKNMYEGYKRLREHKHENH